MDPATQSAPPTPSAAEGLDGWLSAPMVWLAALFLLLAAGVLHRLGQEVHSYLEVEIIYWALIVVWPVFLAEGVLRVIHCVRPAGLAKRCVYLALLVLAPPLRMGVRSYADVNRIWLPRWGWCTVDRHLRKRLERFFSIPMMAIAVLVVPVLAIEYFWKDWIRQYFVAQLFLDIAEGVIWMAFAVEFIVMVSVADRKLRYCFSNWMDLAIVLLPLIDFLPILRTLRLTRVFELQQLTRMGRLYRLRGLLFKLWRAVLLLDVLYRLIGNVKEKRLQRLKELLAAKNDEIEDLCREIADLERELAAKERMTVTPPPSATHNEAPVAGREG